MRKRVFLNSVSFESLFECGDKEGEVWILGDDGESTRQADSFERAEGKVECPDFI